MRKIRKFLFLVLVINFAPFNFCFAETNAGELLRSQELIQEEQDLRSQVEKPQKIYIKKISVSGVAFLNKEELKQIVLIFQKRWLSKQEIIDIIDSLKAAYKKKGLAKKKKKISYQIKGSTLEIQVEETILKSGGR